MRNSLLLAGLAGFVVAAAAPDQGSTGPSDAAKTAAYSTKQICRTETDIGTRLGGKRICRTQQEWDAIRAEQRRTTERIQGSTSACLRSGACGG